MNSRLGQALFVPTLQPLTVGVIILGRANHNEVIRSAMRTGSAF